MKTGSLKQKLVSGSIWVFAGKFVTGIAQILIAMVLTRMLSPEDFGSFQVLQRALLFLALIGSFGMAWVIVRRVAEGLAHEQPGNSVLYAKNIFLIVLVITACLAYLFYFFGGQIVIGLFNININGLFAVLIGLLFCLSFQQIIPEGFRGLHDLKFASIFSGAATNTLMLALLLILYLWFIEDKRDLSDAIYVYFVSTAMIVVISGTTLFRMFMGLNKKGTAQIDGKVVLKNNLTAGVPLTLTNLLSFFVSQADIWIVAALFSVESAAYYGAASRLMFVISAPVMVANGATRGVIADLWAKQNKDKLQRLLRTVASLTVLAALVPATLFLLWGGSILNVLYGSFYVQATGILGILVLGQLVLLAAGPAGTLMILSGCQKQVLYFDVISAVIFCLFAYYLGHVFGPVGIAIASALAISVKAVFTAYYAKHSLNVRTYIGKISIPSSVL